MSTFARWKSSILTQPSPPKLIVALICLLQAIVGGIRFSDGRVLLGLASPEGINAPIFDNQIVQYNWESPLKVLLLRQLPWASILVLAAIFFLFSLLPLVGMAAKGSTRIYRYTALMILFSPALKISLQNVGIGDGLVLLLSLLCIVFLANPAVVFFLLVLIGAWHPGQVVFIAGSVFLAAVLSLQLQRSKSVLSLSLKGLFASCLLAVLSSRLLLSLHNSLLGFEYVNRWEFARTQMQPFIAKNLLHLPVVLVIPVLFIGALLALSSSSSLKVRWKLAIVVWILLCVLVGLLTTDPTRVLVLCLLPLLVVIADQTISRAVLIANKEFFPEISLADRFVSFFSIGVPLIMVFLPLPGWSGMNWTVWGNLINDLCKYGVFCGFR